MMLKYVGMYCLMGIVLHGGLATGILIWVIMKLIKDNESEIENAFNEILRLKAALYGDDSHATLDAYKAFLKHAEASSKFLYYLASMALWPMGVCENLAILPALRQYVNEVKREGSK